MAILFTLLFLAAIVGVFKPYIANSKRWHFGVGAFVMFVLVGMSGQSLETSDEANVTLAGGASEGVIPTANAADIVKPADEAGKWTYDQDVDAMRGETSYYALLEGTNTIDLDFPYGEQSGQLMIRQSPKFGFDILVGVRSGQVLCNSFSNTYLNVKFDDGPIKRYSCTDASDGTNNLVFLGNEKGFLAELRKSKKMIVEAEFYANGIQQLTFDTSNLKWDH